METHSIPESRPSILFRCDASEKIGLGHLSRCLALADELSERGCPVTFAMREAPFAFERVRRHGYRVLTAETDRSFYYLSWLAAAIAEVGATHLILDVRDDLPEMTLETLREEGIVIATLDDPTPRRLQADLAFYPPHPGVCEMDWNGFEGRLFTGWEWVVLRRQFYRPRACISAGDRPRVLVTMGGSDPAGLTLKAVEALNRLDLDFGARVVVGQGFRHEASLQKLIPGDHDDFLCLKDVEDMAGLMANCHIAVASFGVTAYELAAMKVPSILLALSEDHARGAQLLAESGTAVNLGLHKNVSVERLAESVGSLLSSPARQAKMRQAAREISAWGVTNIADMILGSGDANESHESHE